MVKGRRSKSYFPITQGIRLEKMYVSSPSYCSSTFGMLLVNCDMFDIVGLAPPAGRNGIEGIRSQSFINRAHIAGRAQASRLPARPIVVP